MNKVDVSPENIEREIRSLCTEHGVTLPPDLQDPAETAAQQSTESAVDDDVEALFGTDTPEPAPESADAPADEQAGDGAFIPKGTWNWSAAAASREVSQDEQVQMASAVLSFGIYNLFRMAFRSAAPHLDKQPVDDFAYKWAVVLCKYYKGGILELLARFQEEGAAIAATVALIAAIRGAFVASKNPTQEVSA